MDRCRPGGLAPGLQPLAALMAGRERLAVLPTPLHHAPRLSSSLGKEIWLKRDDLTGTGLGGKEIRKLELLAAQARAAGADTLVSVGAPQSNHARTVATVAAMLRLDCHLVLAGQAPAAPSGNLLLDALMGATLHWAGTHDWAELAVATDDVTAQLQRIGRRVFTMPVGGSVPHGSAAFVAAYRAHGAERRVRADADRRGACLVLGRHPGRAAPGRGAGW